MGRTGREHVVEDLIMSLGENGRRVGRDREGGPPSKRILRSARQEGNTGQGKHIFL